MCAPLITAEVGVCWKDEGQFLDLAIRSIDAGANAVKSQYFRWKDISTHPQKELLRPLCMTPSRAWRLTRLLKDHGIELYWTPENSSCVQDLQGIGMKLLKVSHVGSRDPEMLRAVAASGLPTIFSLDPHDGYGLEQFLTDLRALGIVGQPVMYCRGIYPTSAESHDLEVARHFSGFSCHTRDRETVKAMQGLFGDAGFYEYHVRPDEGTYLDQDVSFTVEELRSLIRHNPHGTPGTAKGSG